MSAFSRGPRWFGDDEGQDGPTPLFPPGVIGTDRQSMFPVQSDANPVLGALKSGWKGLGDWLQAPADSAAGSGGDLLGYKPTSRIQAIGAALGGAAKGVMHARGPYSNWFGEGLLGAGEGLEASRKQDLQLRQLAQEQQYKSAAASLAKVKAATAEKLAEHAGEFTLGRTRFDPEGKPIVTAPPEELSEADKARLAQGDERLALDRTQAGSLEAYRQQELALRKAEQAHKGEMTPYQQQELRLAQERLGLSREELKRKDAAASGDPAEALKTQQEREDARLRRYSEMQAKGEKMSDEQSLDYKDLWKQRSAPKYQLDASGNMQEVRPDVTHLTPPPGETAPAPGMTITPTLPGREQMGKAQESYASTQTANAAIGRIEGLLKDATPGQLYAGDTAAKLNTEALAMQGALGELQHAGVLNAGEVDRYNSALGSLTGIGAAAGAAAGYQPVKATLTELRTMLDAKLKNTLPRALSEEDAKRMPKGVPFLMPSGAVGRN